MLVDFSKLRFAVFLDGVFEAAFLYYSDAIDFADTSWDFNDHCEVRDTQEDRVYYRDWKEVEDA